MHSSTRTLCLAIMLGASSACAGYITPSGQIEFYATAPPSPRRESRAVSPGPGHVWINGYYVRRGNDYDWRPGHWEVVQSGYRTWVPGRWRHERRGWFWVDGHWR